MLTNWFLIEYETLNVTWIMNFELWLSSPVAPVSKQYNSRCPGESTPQVADADIFRFFAKLNVGGVNTWAQLIKIQL